MRWKYYYIGSDASHSILSFDESDYDYRDRGRTSLFEENDLGDSKYYTTRYGKFAYVYRSKVFIAEDGDYELELISRGRSVLYLGNSLMVVNNRESSKPISVKQTRHLQRGLYRLKAIYTEYHKVLKDFNICIKKAGGKTVEFDGLPNREVSAPGTPRSLSVSASGGNLRLNWSLQSDDGMCEVFRARGNGEFECIGVTGVGGETFLDTDAKVGANYKYKVKSLNAFGSSMSSPTGTASRNVASATVGSFENVELDYRIESGTGKAVLSWDYTGGTAESFVVERGIESLDTQPIVELDGSAREFTDESALLDTKYFYRLKAKHQQDSVMSSYLSVIVKNSHHPVWIDVRHPHNTNGNPVAGDSWVHYSTTGSNWWEHPFSLTDTLGNEAHFRIKEYDYGSSQAQNQWTSIFGDLDSELRFPVGALKTYRVAEHSTAIVFDQLSPDLSYDFSILSATDQTTSGVVVFSLNGTTKQIDAVGNASKTVDFEAVVPDQNGEIRLEFYPLNSGKRAYLNAVKIQPRDYAAEIEGLEVYMPTPGQNPALLESWVNASGENPSSFDVPHATYVVGSNLSLTQDLSISGEGVEVMIDKDATLNIGSHSFSVLGGAALNTFETSGRINASGGSIYLSENKFRRPTYLNFVPGASLEDLSLGEGHSRRVFINDVAIEGDLEVANSYVLVEDSLIMNVYKERSSIVSKIGYGGGVEGDVSVSKHIVRSEGNTRNAWWYFAPSVKEQQVKDWADDLPLTGMIGSSDPGNELVNVKYFDESQGTYVGFENVEDYLSPGQGVDVAIFNSNFINGKLVFDNKGELFIGNGMDQRITKQETFDLPVSYTEGSSNWNLLSNPFNSPIDWVSTATVKQGLRDAVYVRDSDNGIWGTYINGVAVNGGSQYINPGQSFFVKSLDASASLTISESSKSDVLNTNILKEAETDKQLILLSLKDKNDIKDELAVYYVPENIPEQNYGSVEAVKLYNKSVNLSVWTENGRFAIKALAENKREFSLGLQVNSKVKGTHSLSLDKLTMPTSTDVRLIDHYLDQQMILRPGESYAFDITADTESEGSGRFELVVQRPVELFHSKAAAYLGDTARVELTSKFFSEVKSAVLKWSWDADQLDWAGVSGGKLVEVGSERKGEVTLKYNDTEASIEDAKYFAELLFVVKKKAGSSCRVSVSAESVKNKQGETLPLASNESSIARIPFQKVEGSITKLNTSDRIRFKLFSKNEKLLLDKQESGSSYSVSFKSEDAGRLTYAFVPSERPTISTVYDLVLLDRIKRNAFGAMPEEFLSADMDGNLEINDEDKKLMIQKILKGKHPVNTKELFVVPKYSISEIQEEGIDKLLEQGFSLDNGKYRKQDLVLVEKGKIDRGLIPVQELPIEFLAKLTSSDQKLLTYDIQTLESVDALGYQFTLEWNPDLYEFAGVEGASEHMLNESLVKKGKLGVLWNISGAEGTKLAKDVSLFTLKLKPLAGLSENPELSVSSSLLDNQLVDDELLRYETALRTEKLLGQSDEGDFIIYPNPFVNSFEVQFLNGLVGDYRVMLYDLNGVLVGDERGVVRAGDSSTSVFKFRGLSQGVYVYELYFGDKKARGKIIKK